MPPSVYLPMLFLIAGCAMSAGPATTRAADPLEAMRWERRLVVVFAADANDASLARQRALLAGDAGGMIERRLSVVEVIGDAVTIDGAPAAGGAEAVRRRLDVPRAEPFAVALVGLDGGAKLRRDGPVTPAELFATIDGMPMRRGELRRG